MRGQNASPSGHQYLSLNHSISHCAGVMTGCLIIIYNHIKLVFFLLGSNGNQSAAIQPGLGSNTHFGIKYKYNSAKSNSNTLLFKISIQI